MKILLMGFGFFSGQELNGFAVPGAWRKATRNMIMATASIQRALDQAPGWLEKANDETGLVLGSNSGELETSSDFLMTLSKSGMARPLLFQNSLHNATTGFASIQYKLTGPTFSVSSGARMPAESLLTARALLEGQTCKACLVTLVEGHRMLSGFIQKSVGEGAATVLLATEEFARANGYNAKPEFIDREWNADFTDPSDHSPLTDITRSAFYLRAQRA